MARKKLDKAVRPLVILAGGGDFPLIAAEHVMESGRPVLLVGIEGEASPEIADFPHAWIKRGQLGALYKAMNTFGAKELMLLGTMSERRLPTWREVDLAGLMAVVRHHKLLSDGDDTVLRKVARIIERRGFRIVSPRDVAPRMVARSGLLGRYRPTQEDLTDVLVAYRAAKELGRRDLGQAVVASGGAVIGREDLSGTDSMLGRIAAERHRQGVVGPVGVLVKCMKPGQDERLDMPAIGPATIRNAARAGLAGVAVEAGTTLVIDEDIMVELADRLGLFLLGFALPSTAGGSAPKE